MSVRKVEDLKSSRKVCQHARKKSARFEEYKKSPEWTLLNKDKGMDVHGFKYIFFWEWFHRIVGRSIGVIFFCPMIYFLARGYIQPRLKYTLMSMFFMGGM